MPKAYILAQVDCHDADAIVAYRDGAPKSVRAHGGRILARGGRSLSLEGQAPRSRSVVIEFPSYDIALEWYHSDEYRVLRDIRNSVCDSDMILLEALEEPL